MTASAAGNRSGLGVNRDARDEAGDSKWLEDAAHSRPLKSTSPAKSSDAASPEYRA
jgi:hypothetical protein